MELAERSSAILGKSVVGAGLWLGLAVVLSGCGKGSDAAPAGGAAAAGGSDPTAQPQMAGGPIVAGLGHAGLSPRVRGLVLLGELGCVACHDDPSGAVVGPRRGPDLALVGSRVHPDYLVRFLADPHGTEPGTTMPDLLGRRIDPRGDAEALSAYLRSFAPWTHADDEVTGGERARGRDLFSSIGCAACHASLQADGEPPVMAGSLPLDHVAEKYSPRALREFLLAPHLVRPDGRMPDLHLDPREAFDLGSYLLGPADGGTRRAASPLVDGNPIDGNPVDGNPVDGNPVDGDLVDAGRFLFGDLGCAHCHELPDAQRAAPPPSVSLDALDPARGCLSGVAGAWPDFGLRAAQREDILAALRALDAPIGDRERIQQRLASRNCFACHERGGIGGVSAARSGLFTTSDPALGEDGRMPPSLAGIGAKLQRGWLEDAVAHGQSVRPYMRTRMPGFGAAFGGDLAAILERVDAQPAIDMRPLPEDRDEARAVTELGRELVGGKGMNCIACHLFAGQKTGVMGGLDLVATTGQRLRPDWFARYLRDPFTYKPDTLMPQFFPDGQSTRPELGGGDTDRQIEAMWHYLAQGRNVRKPDGMRRVSAELVVADEAVLLRRSVQDTGKRGISVGYPGGVNVVFDAEHLGLHQLWWGGFVDAAPVWTGQGSGRARILGKPRFVLPNGPALVSLPDPDAAWPDASRRELGQQFLGYDLDAEQRPSFRYVCEGVEVVDTPSEVAGDGPDAAPILRRTLRLSGAEDLALTFRLARGAAVADLGGGRASIDDGLEVRVTPHPFRIRTVGEERELLVEIPVSQGRAELVVEYALGTGDAGPRGEGK